MTFLQMTKKDIDRITIIEKYNNKELTSQEEAAIILNISSRHFRRLLKNYNKEWAKWIIHKARWKPSNRKLSPNLTERIKQIIHQPKFYDFWSTLLNEKLKKLHNIHISNEKLRQIMIQENLWKPKERKKSKQLHNRPRKEHFWDLVQFDGSYHNWLENWNTHCLLVAIDDATWKITKAKFTTNEWKQPVFEFWKEYALKDWMPRYIYLDKFATYKNNQFKNASYEPDLPTEFEKVCNQLWTKLIKANSPQAKWRVERANKTLQDRLVKELRLLEIKDIDEANKFLEDTFILEYNSKFAIPPAKSTDLHISLTEENINNINWIFSQHHTRIVKNDYTIQFKNKYIQLYKENLSLYPWLEVEVQEQFNWNIRILLNWKIVNFKILDEKPLKEVRKEISIKEQKQKEKIKKKRELKTFNKSKSKQIQYKIARLKWITKWLKWNEITKYAINQAKCSIVTKF